MRAILMQIPAALRSVGAALLHGPVVTRFALRLKRVADNAKIRLRAGRGRGERVRQRTPGRFTLAKVGTLVGSVREEGV
jgi:hypothetical protein